MQDSILNTETLNANDYTLKHKNVDGNHQVSLRNNKGVVPTFWSPWMISAFGISSFKKFKGATEGLDDWTLDLKAACYGNLDLSKLGKEYDDVKNKSDIEHLIKFFSDIDKLGLDFAHANSSKLFKKELKRDVIEEGFTKKIVKKSEKKDTNGNFYPDTITAKIMKKGDVPDIVVEDFDYTQITFPSWENLEENLSVLAQKGTPLRAIMQLRPYFVNSKLGFTLKLCAIQVDDKRNIQRTSIFTFREKPVGAPVVQLPSSDSEVDNEEIEVEEQEEEIEV
jgi:hypothetical protein